MGLYGNVHWRTNQLFPKFRQSFCFGSLVSDKIQFLQWPLGYVKDLFLNYFITKNFLEQDLTKSWGVQLRKKSHWFVPAPTLVPKISSLSLLWWKRFFIFSLNFLKAGPGASICLHRDFFPPYSTVNIYFFPFLKSGWRSFPLLISSLP